ncbi:unnamed protein product [Ixodes hexagonus]
MRRLAGCAVTAVLALGLVALCAWAGPTPRRPQNRAFARAAQHEQLVWTEGACRRPQPRVLCLKALRPNDTRVSHKGLGTRGAALSTTDTTLRGLFAYSVLSVGFASGSVSVRNKRSTGRCVRLS